ncbi:MAG: M14 family metallopeptidase [Deferribacteres bacterium]|nr:M14 family metallopeptidase [candidate division KSB1 bacterium]MCB9502611.1 M14 family metallopeptidase [Deferribacteres bacterium]
MKTATKILAVLLFLTSLLNAQPLPPEIPWNGKSMRFIHSNTDPWVTPAEKSGLTQTPDYATTIAWLEKLSQSSKHLTMQSIGKTGQNRDLYLVVATQSGADKPEQLLGSEKPTLLFQAGIHSGEIDGKDAGMMFLRDVVFENPALLDKINILFIPVLSPDGHENSSKFARVNQRGPEVMGWRTNARNLNLNRDYAKAETPEIQALLSVLQNWPVDLYIDIHVTDGVDYQYDVTWGSTSKYPYSPKIDAWIKKQLNPVLEKALKKEGHIPGPLIFARDNKNPEDGIVEWNPPPRFSNGYGDLRHLPTILIENHSLKSYKQRVLGTYVFLQAVCDKLAHDGKALQKAIAQDQAARPEKVNLPANWSTGFGENKPDSLDYLGMDYKIVQSPISGTEEIQWLGKPKNARVPIFNQSANEQIAIPRGYWIPAERYDIIEKLQLHGIKMDVISKPQTVSVQLYRLVKFKLADEAYEGRVRLQIEELKVEERTVTYAPGSAQINMDQPLAELATLLLEPRSEDSFLQWGFFHEILQQTEYIEGYVVEPLAQQMLKDNPQLKQEFEKALQDEKFAKNPNARLRWFYKRSPYYDNNYVLYPVGKEM